MHYRIEFTETARKRCKKIPKKDLEKILEGLENEVAVNPFKAGEKLSGKLKNYRSFHVDIYRIIYRIFSSEGRVAVLSIRHRKDVYR